MQPKPGKHRSPFVINNDGFVLIVVVIIISTILSVVVVTTAGKILTQLEIAETLEAGQAARASAEGCVNEVLLRLQRDLNYAGGNFLLDTTVCSAGVTGSGNTRSLTVTGTAGSYTRTFTLDLDVSTATVSKWVEN